MQKQFTQVVTSQLEAAVAMLAGCANRCPDELWDQPIAKYPFWQVAYHALCFADCYLATSDAAWQPHPTLHPAGRAELSEECPSRRFTRDELVRYAELCRLKIGQALTADTTETLAGPSGFPWLPFSRAELHLYNLRHAQHHAGQLTAFLHRHDINAPWIKTHWPS